MAAKAKNFGCNFPLYFWLHVSSRLLAQFKQLAFTIAVEPMINCSAICNFDCATTDREFAISCTMHNITVNQSDKEFFPLNVLNSSHIQYNRDVKKHVHSR